MEPGFTKTEIESLPGPFEVQLPEVYQIELSSACDKDCKMCPRKLMARKDKEPFFPISLLEKIINEGDLEGSYFTEFQMSGEPLLYPEFEHVINLVRVNHRDLYLGLSTRSSKGIRNNLASLLQLNYITISMDEIGTQKGHDLLVMADILVRTGRSFDLKVDLQLVELPGWKSKLTILENSIIVMDLLRDDRFKDNLRIRTVPDCFETIFVEPTPEQLPVKTTPCLNPFLSVSIQSNGNVVPCCFCFGDDIIYGNLKDQTLAEIWKSDKVKKLRLAHQQQVNLPMICQRCYMRSPTLLHWELFLKSLKRRTIPNQP